MLFALAYRYSEPCARIAESDHSRIWPVLCDVFSFFLRKATTPGERLSASHVRSYGASIYEIFHIVQFL